MNKGTLSSHEGHVLALKGVYGHAPVRLMDTNTWTRHVRTGSGVRFATATSNRYHSDSSGTTGYLVLRLLAPGAMSDARREELTERLGTIELTTADIFTADGKINYDVLPADIGVDIVNNRHLTASWASHVADQEAKASAYLGAREAQEAEWTARSVAREAHVARVDAAKRTQASKFIDDLDGLGVNNMINMVSEHTVAVDVRTLEALIEMAQRTESAELSDRDGHYASNG